MEIIGDNVPDGGGGVEVPARDASAALRSSQASYALSRHMPFDLEVFLALNVILIIGLLAWSRLHPLSFRLFQLGGLLLVPPLLSALSRYWRFICVFMLYILQTASMVRLVLQRPVQQSTPRRVYLWFTVTHRVCELMSYLGICLLFVGGSESVVVAGAELIFYGLYFGVLNRDAAELSAERMSPARGIGNDLRRVRVVAANTCAMCSMYLRDVEEGATSAAGQEMNDALAKQRKLWSFVRSMILPSSETMVLPCQHAFHGYCIRGWTLVGKKNLCPLCGEKVELRLLVKQQPWLASSYFYSFLLALVRVVLVWNPLVFIFSGYALALLEKVTGWQ